MKQKKYPPELRERAVRMLFEHESGHPSRWAATQPIAAKVGCSTEALRSWVRQATEILRKASVSFAQAELDRRFKP